MSTSQPSDESLLTKPLNRYALALASSALMVGIAAFFLEGTIRWVVLAFAVVNAVLEPKILEMAATQEAE